MTMITYTIEEGSVAVNRGITSFNVTWTKNDGTIIGPHYYEVHSVSEEDVYAALDKAAERLDEESPETAVPNLETGRPLKVGEKLGT